MSDLGNKSVFSKNIKKFMEINNVDRYQLADALDVKYTTLTDWINGNSYPRIDKIDVTPVPFRVYRPTGSGNFKYEFIDIERVLAS